MEAAQALSRQLHVAEERIAALEGEVQLWRERAEHAEQWMLKIFKQIEERLLKAPEERQVDNSRRE